MKNFLFALSISYFLVSGCSSPDAKIIDVSDSQKYAIALMGFNPELSHLMTDGKILVEGDVVLDPNQLDDYLKKVDFGLSENESEFSVIDRQRAVIPGSAFPYTSTTGLTYRIGTGFSLEQMDAIRAGVAPWQTAATNLNINEVTTGTSNFLFILGNLGENFWGQAGFPTGTTAGIQTIRLNMGEIIEDCTVDLATCIRNVVTHELGHSLGFHHTDLTSRELIVGTPFSSDPTSMMNSGNAGGGLAGLGGLAGPNANDLNMASALYPINTVALIANGASVTYWSHDNYYCFVNLNYSQPAVGRCYQGRIEVLQNGVVIRTSEFNSTLGVAPTGNAVSSKFALPAGTYQARIVGLNRRGDFVAAPSNTVTFTKAF